MTQDEIESKFINYLVVFAFGLWVGILIGGGL